MTKKARTKTIPLEYPIEWDGAEITEVTLHRPKGADMRRIAEAEREAAGPFQAGCATIEILTDLPVGAIDEIDIDDFEAVSDAIEAFFPKRVRQKNGDPSSQTAPTS